MRTPLEIKMIEQGRAIETGRTWHAGLFLGI